MARNGKPANGISQAHAIPTVRIERLKSVPAEPPPDHLNEIPSIAVTESPLRVNTANGEKPPPPPRKYANGNGNGIMKDARETVVTLDFSEDLIPPSHYCCGNVKIQKVCKAVGILSFVGFIVNLILYFMGISKLGLNGYLEAFILFLDFVSVVCVLCAMSKKKSRLLKPYLMFNTCWNFCLLILFAVCLWHLCRGSHEVSRNIWENLRAIRNKSNDFQYRPYQTPKAAHLAAFLVMAAMFVVIVVNFIFLHIVYRTFHFFAYKEDKKREQTNNKKDRL